MMLEIKKTDETDRDDKNLDEEVEVIEADQGIEDVNVIRQEGLTYYQLLIPQVAR